MMNSSGSDQKNKRFPPPVYPSAYVQGLLNLLANSDEGEAITYEDLDIGEWSESDGYRNEYEQWREKVKPLKKRHFLIQYDVDSDPEATHRLLRHHLKIGMPCNVMVFAERFTSDPDNKPEYDLDYDLLREASAAGSAIGYHCNVWERSGFDEEKAVDLFKKDVAFLQEKIGGIKIFSMHGGPSSSDGRANRHLEFLDEIARELGLIWVHNDRAPRFNTHFDDGGPRKPEPPFRWRVACPIDPLLATRTGQRCRILMHPQYYAETPPAELVNVMNEGLSWFEELKYSYSDLQKQAVGIGGKLKRIFKKPIALDEAHANWFDKNFWQLAIQKEQLQSAAFNRDVFDSVPDNPIFVNGISRSGTTLLAAIFDAHPDFAMSYELYPRYVVREETAGLSFADWVEFAYLCKNLPDNEIYDAVKAKGWDDLTRFLGTTSHSGLTPIDVGDLLSAYHRSKGNIASRKETLEIIGACANFKRVEQKASRWGTKCLGYFDDYAVAWPNCAFLYIVRDGRDVIASQKNTGAFNWDPTRIGEAWVKNYQRVKKFQETLKNPVLIVKYEELATDPEPVVRKICTTLGVDFNPLMLEHQKAKISVLDKKAGPVRQLSADKIANPINTSALHRWKTDLTEQEASAFTKVAAETMEILGYEI